MPGSYIVTLLAFLLALAAYASALFGLHSAPVSQSSHPPPTKMMRLFGLNVSFLIEPNECPNYPQLGILLITSSLENENLRMAQRIAYSEDELAYLGFQRFFVVGAPPPGNDSAQCALRNEALQFHDILQGDFVDGFRNETYKATMGLMWAAKKCSAAVFSIHLCDLIALNLYELVAVLRKELADPTSYRRLAGMAHVGEKPNRNPEALFYLSVEQYPEDTFPDYLSRWMFFGRNRLLGELARNASAILPYLYVQDVFLSGIARKKFMGDPADFLVLNDNFTHYLDCCLEYLNVTCPYMLGPTGYGIDAATRNQRLLRFVEQSRHCYVLKACLPAPKPSDGCNSPTKSKCFCSQH